MYSIPRNLSKTLLNKMLKGLNRPLKYVIINGETRPAVVRHFENVRRTQDNEETNHPITCGGVAFCALGAAALVATLMFFQGLLCSLFFMVLV